MTRAVVAFGANLGAREVTIETAVRALAETPTTSRSGCPSSVEANRLSRT